MAVPPACLQNITPDFCGVERARVGGGHTVMVDFVNKGRALCGTRWKG